MKKIILLAAAATLVMSCKKVPNGGNKGAIKIVDGVERYTDDQHRTVIEAKAPAAMPAETHNPADSTQATVKVAPAATNGTETTVNTMSAPVNNANTDHK